MLELAIYAGRKRAKAAGALSLILSALAAMYVFTFPSVIEAMDQQALEDLIASYPPAMVDALNLESIGSIEGYLASQFYTIGWTLMAGFYFGYAGAGLIADDIGRGRMDTLLFLPLSRQRLVAEKFASLSVPLLAVNLVVPAVIYAGTLAIGHPISALDLAMVHLLSIPYLLCCAAIGLSLSVLVDRASIARRGALVAIFGLFLAGPAVVGTTVEWARMIVPMTYFDTNAVLLHSDYDPGAAGTLLVGALVLVLASQAWFSRRDVA